MSDEIDVESARLEFLMAQKQKRITEILEENEGLVWVKPTAANPDPEGAGGDEKP